MTMLKLVTKKVETSRPGDAYRTYRPGPRRATFFGIPIPESWFWKLWRLKERL
jgi:hypothetical protein